MACANPSPETRFGAARANPGNPGGKPAGARNRICKAFLNALAKDFDAHGVDAIVRTREEEPATYMRVLAGLLPKELELSRNPLAEMTDDELAAAIELVRTQLAASDAARAGAEAASGSV